MNPKDRHKLTNEDEFYIQDLIGLEIYESVLIILFSILNYK